MLKKPLEAISATSLAGRDSRVRRVTRSLPPDAWRKLRLFAAAILGVGGLRFALSVSPAGYQWARYASMTAVIIAGVVYFAPRTPDRTGRALVSYGLIVPYMAVEIAGLGYTWWRGRETIFHADPYTLGTPIDIHFFGHLFGGLTWEPAMVFGLLWAVGRLRRPRERQRRIW